MYYINHYKRQIIERITKFAYIYFQHKDSHTSSYVITS